MKCIAPLYFTTSLFDKSPPMSKNVYNTMDMSKLPEISSTALPLSTISTAS